MRCTAHREVVPHAGLRRCPRDNMKLWPKAKVRPIRFHDLRHTAVSRMINAGVPITKVAKLVGWQPTTMVAMAGRYGHHGLEDLRSAVETVSRSQYGEIAEGSPVNPPVYHSGNSSNIQ